MSKMSKKARNLASLSGGALVVAAPLAAGGTAFAGNTYTVSNLDDSGVGSLRQAVLDANGNAGADTIVFAPSVVGTIELSSGTLDIDDSVTIVGPGASLLTIDGNGDRIFYVYSSDELIDVTISGSTLTGGESIYGGAIGVHAEHITLDSMSIVANSAGGGAGGGVFLSGKGTPGTAELEAVIVDSTISGNDAVFGGGIALYGTEAVATPMLSIRNSTVSGNTAGDNGGGFWTYGTLGASIEILSSTFSGNAAGSTGGAMVFYSTGGIDFTMSNSTMTGNSAGALGGGFATGDSEVVLTNSVISGNEATTGPDVLLYGGSSITGYFSMVGDLDGTTLLGGNNLPEGDAMLGALADNGGVTETHLPLAGSPLIDAGDPAFSAPPSTDQRGLSRVSNGRIDVGAVEVQVTTDLPETGGAQGWMVALGAALLGLGGVLHLTGRRTRSA